MWREIRNLPLFKEADREEKKISTDAYLIVLKNFDERGN